MLPALQLRAFDLDVTLGGRAILDRVDARLGAGELLGVIGPNGAGKSTLLRLMAGLRAPDHGTVELDGAPLARIGEAALARRLGYLPQGGVIHWPVTVRRLVGLGRLPHGRFGRVVSAADEAAIDRALAATDTTELAGRIVTTLSGGERSRVLLARVLAGEPALLLADEPGVALDPRHQLELMALLRRLAAGGMGIAVVLHDLTLAARFCDRLLLLDQGRIAAEGSPREVLTAERLAHVYGIEAATGQHDGEPFILPWAPIRH
jgi:iron complex transport system ATP-binding protein